MSVLLTRCKGFESNESFILGPPLHRTRDDPPVFGIRAHKTGIDDFDNTLPGNVNDDRIASEVQSQRRYRRSTDFSSEESASLVDKHNELRGQVSPEASNMEFMIWDDDLAIMAQEWSDTCYFAHGQPDNISPFSTLGQNLWLGSAGKNAPDGTGAVQAWYNEVQYYDYSTTECSYVCGHYTQVVWASSYAVGCGRSLCEFATSESSNYTNVYIITCNYGPAGNYVGSQPYDDGPSCTQCDSGVALCYNNLCNECSLEEQGCECRVSCENCATISNNCTCECQDGWYGTDCSTECADTHQYCWNSPGWPGPEYCGAHNAVPKRCPYMCGLCNLADPDFVCGSSTTQMATAQVSTNSTLSSMTTSSPNQGDSSTSVPSMTSTATMTTSSPDQEDGSTSVPSMTSTATMTTSSPNQGDSSTFVSATTSTATKTTSNPDQDESSTSVPSMTSTATMTTSSPYQQDGSTSVPSMTSTATMTTSSPYQQDGSTSVASMTSTATMTTNSPNQEDDSTSVHSMTSTASTTASSPNQEDGSTSVPSMTSTATMSAVETQTLSTTSHLMTTSALMGDETTFASETTPPPLTFSSTTEVSISSTGQNNGESTTVSAVTNAGCDDIICQNGGTFEEVSCTCRCANGYQGDACQNLESEVQYGVEITLQASIYMVNKSK
ncbi:protein HEG homolog 1-like [Lytechinus variegatus]|uniref:protein HEG homolog 1-like n=1 Tax=Lytechinus variegatus TaxID=7654 RepID=UPI001BB172F1|nr:protein HEG homolog 1-like [Lytechinus variegatus]